MSNPTPDHNVTRDNQQQPQSPQLVMGHASFGPHKDEPVTPESIAAIRSKLRQHIDTDCGKNVAPAQPSGDGQRTPRTDSAVVCFPNTSTAVDLLPVGLVVPADFARELERENTALLSRLAAAEARVGELEQPDYFDFLAPTKEFHAWMDRYGLESCPKGTTAQLQAATSRADRYKAEMEFLSTDEPLAPRLLAEKQRADALERECEEYRKDINGLMEECSKHISLSNDFPWSEEVYCAFRHLEGEIARLTKTKHTDAFRFLELEATKADLQTARAECAKLRECAEKLFGALETCFCQLKDQQAMPDDNSDHLYKSALASYRALQAPTAKSEGGGR